MHQIVDRRVLAAVGDRFARHPAYPGIRVADHHRQRLRKRRIILRSHQPGNLGPHLRIPVAGEPNERFDRRRRPEINHQIQRPQPIARPGAGVAQHTLDFARPALAQLALHDGNLPPGPVALELRLPQRLFDPLAQVERSLRHGALPAQPIDAAVGTATAGGEVEGAVRAHVEVGDVEGPAFEDGRHSRRITGARPLELHGVDLSPRPVADEQRSLEPLRKHDVVVRYHARRRAGTDVERRRQAVEVGLGPFGPAAPPAQLGTHGNVVDPRRPIPGRADVPFHVGIVGKQLAVRVEGHVVGIAKAAGYESRRSCLRCRYEGSCRPALSGRRRGRWDLRIAAVRGLPRRRTNGGSSDWEARRHCCNRRRSRRSNRQDRAVPHGDHARPSLRET